MSEAILRPEEVKRFEAINKYVLLSTPLLMLIFATREVKFNIDMLTVGILSVCLIVSFGFLYLLWKIILLVTRKKFKSVYVLMVLVFLVSSILDVIDISESIKLMGFGIWICYFLVSIYSLYLLLTKKFRDWIFLKA